MAVGAKAGGLAALLRIFALAFPAIIADLIPVVWVLAALTVFAGNLVAIVQRNIKRLLAYSSIAHAGYLLMVVVALGLGQTAVDATASILFYLVAYTLSTLGAWAVVIAVEKAEGGLDVGDYAGLGRKYPLLAAAMAVFMLSFTGVPPTLGFMGKFYVFRTVIASGEIGLAAIGVLTSLISAYYYLRIIVIMYMQEGEPEARRDGWLNLIAAGAAVGTVLLSIFSPLLFDWASRAILGGL
jgi:NADH-quinone oxidoreductase subunit N